MPAVHYLGAGLSKDNNKHYDMNLRFVYLILRFVYTIRAGSFHIP